MASRRLKLPERFIQTLKRVSSLLKLWRTKISRYLCSRLRDRWCLCSLGFVPHLFQTAGSEAACKAAGKYKTQGKLYEVQDGDICFFKFNVSGGKQGKK